MTSCCATGSALFGIKTPQCFSFVNTSEITKLTQTQQLLSAVMQIIIVVMMSF